MKLYLVVLLSVSTIFGKVHLQNFPGWAVYDTTNSGLQSNLVTSVTVDNGNGVIACTNKGYGRFTELLNWVMTDTSNSSIPSNFITKVKKDPTGRLWFATPDSGFFISDGNSITTYNTGNTPILTNTINDFAFVGTDVWIATEGQGVWKFDGNIYTRFFSGNTGYNMDIVRALESDNQGNLWIGTTLGGLLRYDGSVFTQFTPLTDNLPFFHVQAIEVENDSTIWLGMGGNHSDSCLVKMKNGVFEIIHSGITSGITIVNVWDIHRDIYGKKWIATNDENVGVISYNDTLYKAYNSGSSGLPDNRVYSITQDADSNIWFGTFRGLTVLNERNVFLSVQETENQPLVQVYPNPVSDELRIHCANSDIRTFRLYTYSGQLIRQGAIYSTENVSLSFSEIPTGLYLLRMEDNKGNAYTKRVVKI
jgi:ligand-binding sensor domain-containing protein